jgi:two-component system, OmpR family, response regulator
MGGQTSGSPGGRGGLSDRVTKPASADARSLASRTLATRRGKLRVALPTMKVLVVEDDVQLSELLERLLRDEGHAATSCATLQAARAALSADSFDIVIVDRMLPDGDGLDLCSTVKRNRAAPPVLMLTARGEVHDRVTGLRTGADDYLTKPFEVEELLARLEAVHRRAAAAWFTRVGALVLDHRGQDARAGSERLGLTAREFALLARLADQPDEPVPRAALLADVWQMGFDPGSGIVDVQVSRLRDKLGSFAWMIETVRGVGLRLKTRQ